MRDTDIPSLQITTELLEWLDEPELDSGKKLLQIWPRLQQDGCARLRDMTCREMAPFLQNIIIWEPVDNWQDARVRLMGDGLKFRFGSDIRGHLMSEVFSHVEKPQHIALLRKAMQRDKPSFIKSYMRCGHLEMMTLELFAAPILDVGGRATLALVHVQQHPTKQAWPPRHAVTHS